MPALEAAVDAPQVAEDAARRGVIGRWLLSAPAIVIIFFAPIGPLFVMLAYSFMAKGDYGDVKSENSRWTAGSPCSCSATSSTTRSRSPTRTSPSSGAR